jgi:hypothetical protein
LRGWSHHSMAGGRAVSFGGAMGTIVHYWAARRPVWAGKNSVAKRS